MNERSDLHRVGELRLEAVLDRPELVAPPVLEAVRALPAETARSIRVAAIDPEHAETAATIEHYGVAAEESANCVIVAGRRGGEERRAACVVLATTRADVNGVVRRHLDVRKASFASPEEATSASRMAYGGITPIGLPGEWRLLVDRRVAEAGPLLVGSGIRGSKVVLPGPVLAGLPGAEVIDGLGH